MFGLKRINSTVTCLALISAFLLEGCVSGPDYVKPDVAVPETWETPLAGGVNSGAISMLAWWEELGDPVLSDLLQRAHANNLDVKLAKARVREARAARGITESALWPNVGTSASYRIQQGPEIETSNNPDISTSINKGPNGFSRNTTIRGQNVTVSRSISSTGASTNVTLSPDDTDTPDRKQDYFSAGFDAQWELDIFGGTRRAIEAADAGIEAEQNRLADVFVSLAAEVALNYVDLRASQQRLDITQRNIEAQRNTMRLTQARFEAGLTSEFDAVRAAAQLANTGSQVPLLETEIQQAVHRLSVLCGESPGTLSPILDTHAPIPTAPSAIPAGLPSDLLQRRPDIRVAERELASATALTGVAIAELFPKFTLTGALSAQTVGLNSAFLDTANRVWSIGPGVSWPIFDAGRIRANIEVQDIRREQAQTRYEQSILLALEDVENALVGFAKEQERLVLLQRASEANAHAVRLANERYNRGLEDFLSVLNAQAQVFLSEDRLLQSQSLVLMNLVALYKSLGGGWQESTLIQETK